MIDRRSSLQRFPFGDEEPIFSAPWEAHVFAIALQLHEKGIFTWPEWSEYLSEAIYSNQGEGNIAYYVSWLEALIRLLTDKEIIESSEFSQLIVALQEIS